MNSALLNVGFGVVIGLMVADYRARQRGAAYGPTPYQDPLAYFRRILTGES